jgi:OPA family glycerol-3-phosphate transporter-like MFS transporter
MNKKIVLVVVLTLVLIGIEAALYVHNRTAFTFALPFVAIGIVSMIYFLNNPVGHELRFRLRSYANWLPLGLTYACLYWGRYNLTEAKKAFGDALMPKEDFGTIFAVGAIVYGVSFIVNGPITDRIGGKATILIGATGAAIANLLLGYFTFQVMNAPEEAYALFWPFVFIYAANMYFQSFGAVSIVKVNAAWFHIRERGVFGGIFGTLISLGIYLAFDLTRRILLITKTDAGETRIWWAFFIPAAVLGFWVLVDFFILKDTPGRAGYTDFNTGDAGSADEADKSAPLSTIELYKRIITHPVILMMVAIEFCSGVLRNGIMHWGTIFSKDVKIIDTDIFFLNWGLVLMLAGVTGGFFAGFISDKFFGSRRGPSAFFLYAGMFAGFLTLIFAVRLEWHFLIGFLSFFMSMCVIGVHGMLSGTASMDFGGKKAAATTAGVIDGFVYLGTGVQSVCLGYIIPNFGWNAWPIFLIPFTLIGLFFTRRIWNAFPDAKKKH